MAHEGKLYRNLTAPQVRDLIAGRPPRATAEYPIVQLQG
jgi:hypothetical protein